MIMNYSIYLHIPFCRHRCSYCDFNTYAGLEDLIPQYVKALCREIELLSAVAGARLPVHTIFFGGGTPSLLPLEELERIFRTLETAFDFLSEIEITLEANPGTLSLPYLRGLRSLGVNRLSLGMQSAQPHELQLLERQHGYTDVVQAVTWARQAGFINLNLDLIFGLPVQSLESWQQNLELGLDLQPDHFALYALTLEHGTPMGHWVERGLLSEPDSDLAAEMYAWAGERLAVAGYRQYEISNWAKEYEQGELLACRHNLQYWRNLAYLGFGAGAHGFAGGLRTANVRSPMAYIKRLVDLAPDGRPTFPRTPANVQVTPISREAEIAETMMMGLRLTLEGVSAAVFRKRFGCSLDELFGQQIERLTRLQLLEWTDGDEDRLRLTAQARLLGNQVFVEFI